MWTCFWDWLGKLPPSSASFVGTLTGSSLGLLAILIGALFNAHLNRKRDDTLRDADRRAIASALRAELVTIDHALIKNADSLASPLGDFVAPDLAHLVRIMPAVLQKMGLLDTPIIRVVMDAYGVIDQYCESLMLLGGRFHEQLPAHRRVVLMPKDSAQQVAIMNRQMSINLKEAIERLDAVL